jgi:hypothetical protein
MRGLVLEIIGTAIFGVVCLCGGFLLGTLATYRCMEQMRVDAYMQGAAACEQFHKAQEKRDQLQGVAKTSGRIK